MQSIGTARARVGCCSDQMSIDAATASLGVSTKRSHDGVVVTIMPLPLEFRRDVLVSRRERYLAVANRERSLVFRFRIRSRGLGRLGVRKLNVIHPGTKCL